MLAMLFMAPPPQAGADPTAQLMQTLFMFAAVIGIFYFMMIRPQQKRAKEHQNLLSTLKKGDPVITSSGIHGSVREVDETTVSVTISSGCNVKFDKSAIATIVKK